MDATNHDRWMRVALSLAREVTLSVVLMELDLRRPSICKQFGVTPDKGLTDYLDGSADLEEVLFRPEGVSGSVPVKSKSMALPSMVTAHSSRTGSVSGPMSSR